MSVFTVPAEGPPFAGTDAVIDLIGDAGASGAEFVALPATRLPEGFFDLRTGIAGEITQKFVNYRLKVAVIGDIGGHLEKSEALRAFVRESNRGRQLWFLSTPEELEARLNV